MTNKEQASLDKTLACSGQANAGTQQPQSASHYLQRYESTPAMMHSIDSAGNIINVSNVWLKAMGYTRTEVVGRPSTDFLTADFLTLIFLTEESRAQTNNNTSAADLKMGSYVERPYQMVKKDGDVIEVLISASTENIQVETIEESPTVIVHMTECNHPQSERMRYQEKLAKMAEIRSAELQETNERLTREIRDRQQAQAELIQRANALERSNADLEQFAYVISHDLQEPLRAMTVFSQLLEQQYSEQLDDTANGYINHVIEGGIRMQALINGILAFSRVSYSRNNFEPTDTQQALTTALQNLQAAIEETHSKITYDDLPQITGDSSQITQLFQNLISNAIKFRGAEPPRIHISSTQQADQWLFRITDNGIGIPPEQQSRIFDLFQRLPSYQEQEGYGIGLAICKKIVQRHNGVLSVEANPDQGTTFFFTIPIQKTI
ncbi:MAG: ATP-binding protein [Phormidesmis sp.]